MENKIQRSKKEIVNMLLNQNLETNDEEELIDILIEQPISIDVDKQNNEGTKLGDRVADRLTKIAGSWTFIILFISFLIIWILLNLTVLDNLDPYPFILLNLLLSCLASLQAPVIMMSQNREAKKDSMRSQNDYKVDLKSELILEELHDQMDQILKNQKEIVTYLKKEEKTK